MQSKVQLFEEIDKYLGEHQPDLIAMRKSNCVEVAGQFHLYSIDGQILDSYEVLLVVPFGFPFSETKVWETGGRIERTLDNHTYPLDGSCCTGVWLTWLALNRPLTFQKFVEGPLEDYFTGQSLVESGNLWPYGERSHGLKGYIEAYSDLLKVDQNIAVIAQHLLLLSCKKIKGHMLCPCGTGLIIRKCSCRERLNSLKDSIDSKLIKAMLVQVDCIDKLMSRNANL